MRWGQLDRPTTSRKTNNFKFNFHVLLWGNQQPTWMATLPPEEQLAEIKKWFAAVAERYPDIDVAAGGQRGHVGPAGRLDAQERRRELLPSSGNYVQALGGANGTDGTGYDWILNAFRLAQAVLPEHQADAQRRRHHRHDGGDGRVPEDHQHPQAREPDRRRSASRRTRSSSSPATRTCPRSRATRTCPWTTWRMHKANLDRLAATGIPIQITELDLDGLAGQRRRRATRCSWRYYRNVVPDLLGAPGRRGHHALGLAPAQPLAQRPERADRALQRHARSPRRAWLYDYVRGDRAGDPAGPGFTRRRRQRQPGRHASQADDWASQIGRPNLRTFTWRITGGNDAGIFAIVPEHRRAHASPSRTCSTSTPPTR